MIYGRCSKLCEVKWFWFIRLPIKIHMTAFGFPKYFYLVSGSFHGGDVTVGGKYYCLETDWSSCWMQCYNDSLEAKANYDDRSVQGVSKYDSVVSNWARSKLPLKVSWSERINVLQSQEFSSWRAGFRLQPQERSRGKEIGGIQMEGTRRRTFQ